MMTSNDAHDLRDLYQDLILDHGKNPRNFHPMPQHNREALGHNPLCGDKITLTLIVNEAGIVTDAAFQGSGCAISIASCSMMTEMVRGKTILEAKRLFDYTHASCMGEGAAPQDIAPLDLARLEALAGVRHYPIRVKCATLAWHTLVAALDNKPMPASTESI